MIPGSFNLNSRRTWFTRVCIAVPLLMLFFNLVSWWRWGTDLPFVDDWRAYVNHKSLSFSIGYLFSAENNTVSPLGIFLDVLAQMWLGGNPLPYQTLTMITVLGGLLWLQWQLLKWALGENSWNLPLCFLLCIFMLQSGTYWGEQNLAYHQALPLLALLGAMWINFCARRIKHLWRFLIILFFGLVAGLSYISGAVGALVVGLCWIFIYRLGCLRIEPEICIRLKNGGIALVTTGALTTFLQIILTRLPGADIIGQSLPLTWPSKKEFWIYAAGKLGRSTGQMFDLLWLEVSWVLIVLVVIMIATGVAFRSLMNDAAPNKRVAFVAIPLFAAIFVYLGLVSLGRAGFHDESISGSWDIFSLGYERFHFFWITLLYPWIGAIFLRKISWSVKYYDIKSNIFAFGAIFVVVLSVSVLAWWRGIFDIDSSYQKSSEARALEIRCIHEYLGSSKNVGCPEIGIIVNDWNDVYGYARKINASFIRYFPIVPHINYGDVMFDWSISEHRSAVKLSGITNVGDNSFLASDDPFIILPVGEHEAMTQCTMLDVQATISMDQSNMAQLFYRPTGEYGYSEKYSLKKNISPDKNGRAFVEFIVESDKGFEPEFRLDPQPGPGYFGIVDLRATCRMHNDPTYPIHASN